MTSLTDIRHLAFALATASSLLLGAAAARAADVQHVRGTIASVDGPKITIKEDDGKQIALTFGDDWKLAGIVPASLSDVKQGTYIGTANMEGADGNKALEVVIFPEGMRGTGDGNYGWDLKPKSSMTNANVNQLVKGVDGSTVTLGYKGGEKKVTIPPTVPVVTFASATKDDLQPGAKVFIAGAPSEDGMMLTKGFIAIGKNGTTPPM